MHGLLEQTRLKLAGGFGRCESFDCVAEMKPCVADVSDAAVELSVGRVRLLRMG